MYQVSHSYEKVWVLTENLHNAEGFEQLFSITGHAGKADDLVEKLGQVFIKIKIKYNWYKSWILVCLVRLWKILVIIY